jgi:hypothetical protein
MIKTKNLPGKLDDLTVISGRDGRDLMVIDLEVAIKKEYVLVAVYIPEGIY